MLRSYLIFTLLGLFSFGVSSLAQSTDSLVLKEWLLQQENNRYIQMAQRDNVISASQVEIPAQSDPVVVL